MTAQVYQVRSPAEVNRITQDVLRRLKLFGPVEVVVTKLGEPSEYQAWMRRYHKLVALVAQNVEKDGRFLRDSEWDLLFKADFLPLDEVLLPDGRVYPQLMSKTKLTRDAREDFLNRVREFAAGYGIFLQHPEEGA